MKVLIVGAAGYVGSIIVPALARQHQCRYLDLRPVPGHEGDTLVGDLNNQALVEKAVEGMDAVVYVALGVPKLAPPEQAIKDVSDIDSGFRVNVTGTYRVLSTALDKGVRRFVYASSMNIYANFRSVPMIDDDLSTTEWHGYGLSKRLGEYVCRAAHQAYPDATLISLRLIAPRRPEDWGGRDYQDQTKEFFAAMGPQDTQRLFLAAVACDKPGAYFLTTTGELKPRRFSHAGVHKLLGWLPEGK